jgi:exosortase/archaeosortase family protein
VIGFSAILVYEPNYFTLQLLTAQNSALILREIGYDIGVRVVGNSVTLGSFELTRECAAVQAIVPLSLAFAFMPRIPHSRRFLAMSGVLVGLYLANLARIVLELVMNAFAILPWYIIHDYFGFAFSVATVVLTIFLAGKLVDLNTIDIVVSKFKP